MTAKSRLAPLLISALLATGVAWAQPADNPLLIDSPLPLHYPQFDKLRDEHFAPALDLILSREPKVDHILIETSGLALPKPLIQAFNWPNIKSRVTVDGVIAVVDGVALAEGRVAHDMEALAAQRTADESLSTCTRFKQ